MGARLQTDREETSSLVSYHEDKPRDDGAGADEREAEDDVDEQVWIHVSPFI